MAVFKAKVKKVTKFRGFIDGIDSGFIYGWASNEENSEPVKLNVVVNGRVVAQGEAAEFRQDLQDAGIHDGYHGFKLPINTAAVSTQGKVELVESESLSKIEHNNVMIDAFNPKVTASIIDIQDGHLVVHLNNDSDPHAVTLRLSVEGETQIEPTYELQSGFNEVRIALPLHAIDGQEKLYEIGIESKPEALSFKVLAANPIITPWQYLKDSYKKPGFLSMPKQADHRYESLTYQLERLATSAQPESLKNLLKIHDVIVEGYEGRKSFPQLALPKVENPLVSIIVPAYNKFELTYHCIASIALSFNKTSYEVILADDCSTDDTTEAETIIENLVVSRNPENLRFLRSCNRATDLAKGKYIVFLNNDTEVTSYWLDELVDRMEKDPSVGMTGSKLLNTDGSLQEAGGIVWESGKPWNVGRNRNPVSPEFNYAREVDYLTGAAMCIRAELWESVGKFSEELVPCYYEDTDLAFKVRDAGFKTVYIPHSVVIHFEGKSHGTDVTKGLKRYQVVNEKTFAQKWYKDFKNNGKASMENMMIEKDRNVDHRVLVIDYASPMPNKDAGSYAAVQEMKLLLSLGFKVTFVPENLAHFGKYTMDLQRMGVEVLYAPFYTSMDDVLNKRLQEMDAVYITRYSVADKYLDRIRAQSKAKVVFNNADLHFLRELRYALKNREDSSLMQAAIKTRDVELGVCRKVDAILCYNTTEHAVIASHILQDDKMHVTPWVLEEKTQGPAMSERKGISFLGGYNHTPNVEAVEYLCKEIMPKLLKQRPDITLHVYGSNMPDAFADYETDNVKMVGFAENLDDVYHSHRVFVAPLLSGAGIKGKVLEAMAYGTPCVLTEVAAEGTGLTQGVSAFIAQKPEEWVNAIIKLYDDQETWKRFSETEAILVKEKFSFEHGKQVFKEIFSSVGIYTV